MPITQTTTLPASAAQLTLPTPTTPLYLIFIASEDPSTGQPWCSDVRAALPSITTIFSAPSAPHLGVVEVGQKPAWKEVANVYRMDWGVRAIPTLVRYELSDGVVTEVARLVEGELLDRGKIAGLLG
ncbi:hypothetical protein P280DRAFT_470663 [Massarina eburnea CBS 473.64]|uniref:Thioredoxin domain-containing protein n=1 Tax=Massarina eburnea CBS 473.64 TaxID=1395130 RepID=A0A6A6RXY5_9PLEO|nr:hypothetical protein P280DRAFT_470663 [Massarina eburnea CBS 473.64]